MKILKWARDYIITRIIAKGEKVNYRPMTEAERRTESPKKLCEESKELHEAVEQQRGRDKIIEEAADVLDAFELFLDTYRISHAEVMQAQVKKRRENGGFEGGWLLEVEVPEE